LSISGNLALLPFFSEPTHDASKLAAPMVPIAPNAVFDKNLRLLNSLLFSIAAFIWFDSNSDKKDQVKINFQ
jgi:hypothetical protein